MPNLGLDLRYLRCAQSALDSGSIRRAADILGLSQSTTSRRIQMLERRLGFQLFERFRTGVRPTKAGEEFLCKAEAGAQLIASAARSAAATHGGLRGQLKVGTSPMCAQRLQIEILQPFRRRFPDVAISLIEGASGHLHDALAKGQVDLAFVIGVDGFPGCESRILWREAVFVGFNKSHRLAERTSISWGEIRHESFVASSRGSGLDIVDFLRTRLLAPDFLPVIEVHDISEAGIFEIVSAGHGVTLSCRSAARWWPDEMAFRAVLGEEATLSSRIIWIDSDSNPSSWNLRGMLESEWPSVSVHDLDESTRFPLA